MNDSTRIREMTLALVESVFKWASRPTRDGAKLLREEASRIESSLRAMDRPDEEKVLDPVTANSFKEHSKEDLQKGLAYWINEANHRGKVLLKFFGIAKERDEWRLRAQNAERELASMRPAQANIDPMCCGGSCKSCAEKP
jgi:hypothetical protein